MILSRAYLRREVVVFAVLLAAGFLLLAKKDAVAFLSGYALFIFDLLAIGYLAKEMIAASKNQAVLSKGGLAALFFAKLVVLMGALFFVLVVLRLNGFYFAAGALLALLGTSVHWGVTYMKSKSLS